MKTLYLDCFSGISGNMFIGMLIQAGVPFEAFKQAMASLNLTGYDLVCRSVNKLGIQSIYYNVLLESEGHGHEHHHHHDHDGHEHAHHEHPEHHDEGQGHLVDTTGHHHHHQHRGLPEITKIIESAPIDEDIKAKSLAVFQALAEA